jgi:LysM repeat protein
MTFASIACGLPLETSADERAGHLVVKGDTLSGIAENYRVRVSDLMKANGLSNDLIKTGQRLRIPAAHGQTSFSDPAAAVRRLSEPLKHEARSGKTIVVHHSAVDGGNARERLRSFKRLSEHQAV